MTQTARQLAALAVLEVLATHACTISAELSLGERIAVKDELLAIEAILQARAVATRSHDATASKSRREVCIRDGKIVR